MSDFSIEDLEALDSAVVDVDPEAHTDDKPALPDDGTHLCEVTFAKVSDNKKLELDGKGMKHGFGFVTFNNNDGQLHTRLYLEFNVPNADGVTCNINAYPSSEPDRRNPRATPFDDILRDIDGQVGIGLTATQKAAKILKHIQAGGKINIRTEWRAKFDTGEKSASGYSKEKVALYGQEKHPPKVNAAGDVVGYKPYAGEIVPVGGIDRQLYTSVEIVAYGAR